MGEIIAAGLGPGEIGLLTLETWELLTQADELLLRTAKHPTADALRARGVAFESYDAFYDAEVTFEAVYGRIVDDLLQRAAGGARVVYAVPGSPVVAERTVALLRERAAQRGVRFTVLAGMSFVELVCARLGVDPIEGLTVVDGADVAALPPDLPTGLVVTQVYNRQVASDIKLRLMELYGDETEIALLQNLGLPDERICHLPLYELDRQSGIDHLTSVYVPPRPRAQRFELQPLTDVMARLRSPGGCVWDIEQTHRSLRRNLIEEVYEVVEAIDLENSALLCEELGDLLLQIVFHARMAEESGAFSMQDVVDGIVEKLVRRHPHVFGDVTVRDAGEVVLNWEAIKQKEKAKERRSVLDGVPKDLPALSRAAKLQQKAAKVGFDWDDIAPVWDKIREEIAELEEAIASGDAAQVEAEYGDVLFSLVNLGRFLGVDAEVALHGANRKFACRFAAVEKSVREAGRDWAQCTLKELDAYWNEAKVLIS